MAGLISAIGRGISAAAGMGSELYAKGAIEDQRAKMQAERDMRLEELQIAREGRAVDTKNKERTDMVGRIDAAASDLAEPQIQAKRGLISSGIADPSSWTPEQQSAVDQSLALDKKGLIGDPATRKQAAINTGDITPKDAATMADSERRLDITEKRAEEAAKSAAMKDATERYKADLKDADSKRDNDTANRRLEGLVRGIGKSGSSNPTKEALSFIDGVRKDLASEATQVRGLYQAELKDALMPEEKTAVNQKYKPQLDAIEKKRAQMTVDFNSLREKVGLPAHSTAPDKPAKPDAAAPAKTQPSAALAMPAKKEGLKAGSTYQTSRGPAKWNGTAFEAQ